MRLVGSLIVEGKYHQLLGVVKVESDTAEPWGEGIVKRKVVGSVTQFGPLWNEFMAVWQDMANARLSVPFGAAPFNEDGHDYMGVRALEVDHDLYGHFAYVSVEGNRIRLILLEHFDGAIAEFSDEVKNRNSKVQDYLDLWDTGRITGNDLRELSGLCPRDEPHLKQYLSAEVLEKARQAYLPYGSGLTLNTII